MISFEEALGIVTTDIPVKPAEKTDFHHAVGRVLAEDIFSDISMPPFNKAAVDGFACRRMDIQQPMQMIEIIPAGKKPQKSITPHTCSKIMTGAMMPDGADCVVMVEQTKMDGDVVLITEPKTKDNIAFMAEDIREGEKVLSKGTLLKPQHIAVLASAGAIYPLVYQKVMLTVLSTGDELVEPEMKPKTGQIRNSNGSQLVAQAIATGASVFYGGIVSDDEETSRSMLKKALSKSDVVILSGGISMGDYDYIPRILSELGIEILFRQIAVQPGKPSVFARSGNKFVFALPGNPVSSFNIFELLAKPFIYRLMGCDFQPLRIRIPLGEAYKRNGAGRHGFVPAIINDAGEVLPIHYHGSAHINALVKADALISIPLGITEINKGDLVDVRLI